MRRSNRAATVLCLLCLDVGAAFAQGRPRPTGLVLAPSAMHSCATTTGGGLTCWGPNVMRALGPLPGTAVPRELHRTGVVQAAIGSDQTCVLLADRTVACRGNSPGATTVCERSEVGPLVCNPEPRVVPGLTGAVQIVAGHGFGCGRLADGTVRCWGASFASAPGRPNVPNAETAVAISGLADVVELAAASTHVCARTRGGRVTCWGYGDPGVPGGDAARAANGLVDVPLRGAPVTQLAVGHFAACALRADGSVWCWGDNRFGELGNGSAGAVAAPAAVPGLAGVTRVVAGHAHFCALRADRTVACWGSMFDRGLLGAPTPDTCTSGGETSRCSLTPRPVPELTEVTDLASGEAHVCVLRGAVSELLCWGRNTDGQLGSGATGAPSPPTRVRW